MIRVLAIDPGNTESGVCLLSDYKPLYFGKFENEEILKSNGVLEHIMCKYLPSAVVIEMVAHYGSGMAVGKTVFETCIYIGRIIEWLRLHGATNIALIPRKHYIAELTGSAKAKDGNVIQYLVDRFAPNEPNHGKGTKKAPGWFYGFKADVWQACALGVYYTDLCKKEPEDG